MYIRLGAEVSENPFVVDKDVTVQLEITCPPETVGEPKCFDLEAKVVRVEPEHIGISFSREVPEVCRALQSKPGVPEKANKKRPRKPVRHKDIPSFKQEFKSLLDDVLPPIADEFLSSVQEKIILSAATAGSNVEEDAHFEAIRLLERKFPTYAREICQTLVSGVDDCDRPKPDTMNPEPSGGTDGELQLVDNESFEDWLSLTATIRKLESRYRKEIETLEFKLSSLTGIAKIQQSNPVSASTLCDSFQSAVSAFVSNELHPSVKQILFKEFELTLLNNIPMLYAALDKLLDAFGASVDDAKKMPVNNAAGRDKGKTSNTQRANSDVDKSESDCHDRSNIEPSPDNEYDNASPADSALVAANTSNASTNNPNRYEQSANGPNAQNHRTDNIVHLDTPGAPGKTKAHHKKSSTTSALRAAASLQTLLHNATPSAAGTPTLSDHGANSDSYNRVANAISSWSRDEKIVAFKQLQSDTAAGPGGSSRAVRFEEELLALLANVHGETKTLSPDEKYTSDLYQQLYDTVTGNLLSSEDSRDHLNEIRWPLYSLALSDPSFVDSSFHPAKGVVDKLERLAPSLDDKSAKRGKTNRAIVDSLVKQIAARGVEHPEVFEEADQELEELVTPYTRSRELNIKRVVEECQGKQRTIKAQEAVQRAIHTCLAESLVPKAIVDLLDCGWRQVMMRTHLREGEHSEYWNKHLKVIDDLMQWLSGERPLSGETKEAYNTALEYIDKHINSASAANFTYKKVKASLNACLLETQDGQFSQVVEMTAFNPDSKAVQVESTDHNRWSAITDQLEEKDWLSFTIGEEPAETLQLVWVGETPNNYVFVNRKGLKKLELNAKQLAELMHHGDAIKVESLDSPIMDRAANLMIQNMHEKLRYAATHDPATNLINANECIRLLDLEYASGDVLTHCFLYITLNDFDIVINNCGVEGGNEFSRQISTLVAKHVEDDAAIARLSEATYGLLLRDVDTARAHTLAETIRDDLVVFRYKYERKSYATGVSIGVVTMESHGDDGETLIKNARSACNVAERVGNNQIHVYDDGNDSIKDQKGLDTWAGMIDEIIGTNRLYLRCQEIQLLSDSSTLPHYEILLGVRDESNVSITPENFIRAAEYSKRMIDIDKWVINSAFRWITDHADHFATIGGFSINISGQSLNDESFIAFLCERIDAIVAPREKITFEITETVAANNLAITRKFTDQIKNLGCKLSLDDFGTGYSSYSYLRSLNVDFLKIDGTFVRDVTTSEVDRAMVKSMNDIGHSLGMKTVAEYVENEATKKIIAEIGVDYGQGWAISKPLQLGELART